MFRGRSFHSAFVAFAVSVALGAAIPVARKLALGDPDPFQGDWPIFLQTAACLAALAVSWHWRQILASPIGIYAGLAGYLLILGKAEYPASSMIALAIHGFLPAVAGSLISLAVNYWKSRAERSTTSMSG
jgi:hypothetical protein